MEANDTHLGAYVYCASHIGPHTSGWCGVPNHNKLGLLAETPEEAQAEVISLGLPWYGHCGVCYKWIANARPYQNYCKDHPVEEKRAYDARALDLRIYLLERQHAARSE